MSQRIADRPPVAAEKAKHLPAHLQVFRPFSPSDIFLSQAPMTDPDFLTAALTLSALLNFILLINVFRSSSDRGAQKERERAHAAELNRLQASEAELVQDVQDLRATETLLLRRQTELETQLSSREERHEETRALLSLTEDRFKETFRNLSTDALRNTQEDFIELARITFRHEQATAAGELERREQAVSHLVQPVAASLEKMQERILDLEKAREGAYATLREQVHHLHEGQTHLRDETARLVKALRKPTGRGQWGEMQLQRVVEMAGMQEHCDFVTQTTRRDDEGHALRPDLLVKLPGGKQVVVDAKTPMDAYLEATEAEDETTRSLELKRHARQVATHIRQLSSKSYQSQFSPTPEFVVLFLPSESFFSAALAADSTLLEQGVDQNVILATPTTLIALLRSVAYGWRQESLARNALKIAEAGGELHKRLITFTGHLSKVGKSLDSSVKSYNSALGSLDRMVLPAARRLEELEAAESQLTLESPSDIPTLASAPKSRLTETKINTGDRKKREMEDLLPEADPKAQSAADDFRAALD